MSDCNLIGSHAVRLATLSSHGAFSGEVCGKHTVLSAKEIKSNHNILTGDIKGSHLAGYVMDESRITVCVATLDKIYVLWYVYGDKVVTISDKYFGISKFK